MTRLVLPVFVVLVGLITLNVAWGETANSSGLSLVPWPKTLRPWQGAMPLTERSRIVASDKTLVPLAAILADEIFTVTGVRLATGDGKPGKGDIALVLDPSLKGDPTGPPAWVRLPERVLPWPLSPGRCVCQGFRRPTPTCGHRRASPGR